MSMPRNLQNPKKTDKVALREAAEEKAKALLSQAVERIGVADEMIVEATGLADRLSSIKKQSIKTYWEAGRLLTEARQVAPHGTWGKLRDAVGLASTTEYLWRDLYQQVSEKEIDRVVGLGYTITQLVEEHQIGRRKTKALPKRVEDSNDGRDEADATTQVIDEAEGSLKQPMDALRIWRDDKAKGGPCIHAANWRGKILCSGRVIDVASETLGEEEDITCIKCLGNMTRDRLEAERLEREKTPHGSEIGYVWEILEGDAPDSIKARWLPIKEVKGKRIVTPEKTFVASEPVFRDRCEALESVKAKYQQIVERDQAEIDRLKAEEDRLKQEKRLVEKKLQKIEALLQQEA